MFRKYDRTALPVVDSNGILVGIVTIDDMLDVAEAEATEDIQKFGGMEALEEPYMTHSALSDGAQTRRLARDFVPGRNIDRNGNGQFSGRTGEGACVSAVSAAYHFQRRQFRLASFDIDDSSHGAGRSDPSRLVAGDESRSAGWARTWSLILGAIGIIRVGGWAIVGRAIPSSTAVRPALAPRSRLTVWLSRSSASCFGGHFPAPCFPFILSQSGRRSRGIFRPVCRYACRCHWIGYLFRRGAANSSRHDALGATAEKMNPRLLAPIRAHHH